MFHYRIDESAGGGTTSIGYLDANPQNVAPTYPTGMICRNYYIYWAYLKKYIYIFIYTRFFPVTFSDGLSDPFRVK